MRTASEVPIDLPIADATVKEKRGEVYVNVGRNLSDALRVDGGINFEFSHLTVGGDATADRKLKFFKPNITLDWKPGGGWHAQFSVQSDGRPARFLRFHQRADLSTQRVNGGNANLQPQRTWEFRATADHPLVRRRPVQARPRARPGQPAAGPDPDLRSAPEDRQLCFDAPGNLGTGRRDFAQLTLDAPLSSALERPADQVRRATLQRTRVDDPINRRDAQMERLFSRLAVERSTFAAIPGDAPTVSQSTTRQRFTFYRTDEFDTNFNGGALLDGVRRVSAMRQYGDHARCRQCARTRSGDRRPAAVLPQPRDAGPRHRRISRAQPPPQLRPDAQAELRRRRRRRWPSRSKRLRSARLLHPRRRSWRLHTSRSTHDSGPSQPSCRSTGRIRSISIIS